jgi:RecA-family ATPase
MNDKDIWESEYRENAHQLPPFVYLSDLQNKPIELAEPIIDGVLRRGHKMLFSGASKAGKSFLIMQLCLAIANGGEWIGFKCKQGAVLYVNLEIDEESARKRFNDIMNASKQEINGNLITWNLKGLTRSQTIKDLIDVLIEYGSRVYNLAAVVIDPMYKLPQGDENSAHDMAMLCDQLDRINIELGCAVICVHHHSKGAQGYKAAMDRASGSGVFARDADALADLIEIQADDLPPKSRLFRVSFDVREFPPLDPIEILYTYPTHQRVTGYTRAKEKYGADASRINSIKERKDQSTERKTEFVKWVKQYYEAQQNKPQRIRKPLAIQDAVLHFHEQKGFSKQNIYNWAKDPKAAFKIENGHIYLYVETVKS